MTEQLSPRTADRPMAFRWSEFRRGAIAAFATFNILFVPVCLMFGLVIYPAMFMSVLMVAVIIQAVYVIAFSVAATVLGGIAALGLGLLLRGVRQAWIHLAAFAVWGAIIAVTVMLVVNAWPEIRSIVDFGGLLGSITTPIVATPLVLLSAFSVAYGWRFTASRALLDDEIEATARAAEESVAQPAD